MSDEESQRAQSGHLYLVGTPIGNRLDISARAKLILSTCDIIACEDTRTSGKLLALLNIEKPLVSYHEHNEKGQSAQLAEQIKSGQSIALISDAGMPNLSDPGYRVVKTCRDAAIPVVPIPGASAGLAALTASGLPSHGYLYVGFLPPKTAARKRFFEKYKDFEYSLVVYESRHRIQKFMQDCIEVLGADRIVCVAREITKLHETFIIGKSSEVMERLTGQNLKGEFVVIIASEDYRG